MGRRVGVVFGGRSVEHRVSLRSARTVAGALREAGHDVVLFGIAPDGCWVDPREAAAALAGGADALTPSGGPVPPTLAPFLSAALEVVFPIVHGTGGEDGTLQGLCEMLDLPYVGAGVTPSALSMDKRASKVLFQAAGVPVVEWRAVGRRELASGAWRERVADLAPPLFVKPSVGGSSVGVRRVDRAEDLEEALRFALRFDDTALVERSVAGREVECSVLGLDDLAASPLLGEIVPGGGFYDYAEKYLRDTTRLVVPAPLAAPVVARVRRLAVEAFAAVGGWGMARVDFLVEEEAGQRGVYVNEINTLPGFTSISMYPRLWEASGLPLPDLVDRLVAIALERHAARRRLDEGIRGWLSALE